MMSKNTCLRKGVIFSGGRRSGWVAGISEGVYVGPTNLLGVGAPPGCVQYHKIPNIAEKSY